MDKKIYKLFRKAKDNNNYQLGISIYNSLLDKNVINNGSYEIMLSLVNSNYKSIGETFMINLMDDLKLCNFSSETIYTLFIRFLTLRDRLDDTIIYLSKLKDSKFKIKRRTYLPIIESSYKLNREDILVKILNDIITTKIYLNQEDYIELLNWIIENNKFELFDTIKNFIKSYIDILIFELLNIFKRRYLKSYINETQISDEGICQICKSKLD